DDGTWSGTVLLRAGAKEKRARRDDAVLFLDGNPLGRVGPLWLQHRVWHGSEPVLRRHTVSIPEWRDSDVGSGEGSDRSHGRSLWNSPLGSHGLPDDVLRHHPRPDLRRLARGDEIQGGGRI